MGHSLATALDFFRERQDELAQSNHGQFVVIHEKEIMGIFQSEIEAYEAATAEYQPGTFLLRPCLRRDEEEGVTFHSRAGSYA